MKYTIYKEATGDILRYGSTISEDAAKAKIQDNEAIIIGEQYPDDQFKIENGKAIPKPPYAPSLEDQKSIVISLVQKRLDDFAAERGYDGILSATSYATSEIPQFALEGKTAVTLRDQTWLKCYSILTKIQDGSRPLPGSFAEIEPELPTLEWSDPQ